MITKSQNASKTLKSWGVAALFALVMVAVPCVNLFLLSGHEEYARSFKKHMIKVLKKKGVDLSWSNYPAALELSTFCEKMDDKSQWIDRSICEKYLQGKRIDKITHTIALITLIFTIALIILLIAMGFLARRSRELLFRLFKPGLYLSQVSTILLTVANIACLILYFYTSGTRTSSIVIMGVFSLVAIVLICYQSFSSVRLEPRYVWGKIATRADQPSLWAYVDGLARKLGTTPPDTIIIGMDPSFYVTEAPLIEHNGEEETPIHGKSLFLSLPYCNVLSHDELASIIGHELGHFIGEDTIWGTKFFPIYQRTENTINSLGSSLSMVPQIVALAAFIPSYIFMKFFLRMFETAEKKMSRQRELEADRVGIRVSNKEAQATALVKTLRFHRAFTIMDRFLLDACMKASIPNNIIIFFDSAAQSLEDTPELKASLNADVSVHPTDTHPPLIDRLSAIGVTLDDVYDRSKIIPTEPASSLFENLQKLEEELTAIEAKRYMNYLAYRASQEKE